MTRNNYFILNFLFLVFSFLFSDVVYAGCNDARRKCENECTSAASFFNYEKGEYQSLNGTDFQDNCSSACKRGFRYCTSEDNLDDGCDVFKRKCRNDCPSSIFSYKSSIYILLTDANSVCEDACRAGYRRCN